VTTPQSTKSRRKRGRPQLFDRQVALDAAMKLFWERGYEGTSFNELTSAMNVSPSTFYNSFGSKELLFEEAVQYFLFGPSSKWMTQILTAPDDTKTVFKKLIERIAFEYTSPDSPAGCMISLAATHVPPELQSVRDMMVKYRAGFERKLAERLQQGVKVGDLPKNTDVALLAEFFGTLFRGMAVQARDGKSQKNLLALGRIAMRIWPAKDTSRISE